MPASIPASKYTTPGAPAQYDKHYGTNGFLATQLETFIRSLPPKSHIIDCGCGTGRPIAQLMAKANHHVHGIDLSEEMIAACRTNVPAGTFTACNMLTFSPPAGTRVDAVVASLSTIEMKRGQIEEMVQKWAQWLMPGGKIMLVVMAADAVCQIGERDYDQDGLCVSDYAWKFRAGDPIARDMRATLFTRRGWRLLLGGKGLKVLKTREHAFVPVGGVEVEMHYYLEACKPL